MSRVTQALGPEAGAGVIVGGDEDTLRVVQMCDRTTNVSVEDVRDRVL